MDQLAELDLKLETIASNIRKSINRPYTSETKQKKFDEIRQIIKDANEILKKINTHYLSSDDVEKLQVIKTSLKENREFALSKLQETEENIKATSSEHKNTEPLNKIETENISDNFEKQEDKIEKNKQELDQKTPDKKSEEIMTDTFDLPKFDGTEESVQALVDAIEMYDDMLNAAGKISLTKFILKTRLNSSAKLRLANTYPNNAALIADMKTFLLSKKSYTSLAAQLGSVKQNNKSINNFGKEIEELFVQLTLAQADGDNDKFTILKPANEEIAINSFAKGLNNSKLRTIIRARNYASLNEAIRGALDNNNENKTDPIDQNFGIFPNLSRKKSEIS